MKRVVLLVVLALAVVLGGCASNGFTNFYSGMTLEQLQADPYYEAENNISVGALPNKSSEEVVLDMFSQGYHPIGTSSWNGPGDNGGAEAIAQAKKIGASLVLWKADYTDTRTGAMPITTYNPGGTSTTHHSGNIYSGGSSGSYSGTSTTYHAGTTSTNYVPFSVTRYDYLAVFFAKFKPGILGIKGEAPGAEYMRKFDTRAGMMVLAVVKDWRAYKADIFPGDIIMAVNGTSYFYGQRFNGWKFGEENIIQVYRDGNIIEKKLFVEGE